MFFRIGADANLYGNGCHGNYHRYPALFISDSDPPFLWLYLSDSGNCRRHYDLSKLDVLSKDAVYHIAIWWNSTTLSLSLSHDANWPVVHEWARNDTDTAYIGEVVPVWWMSNKFGSTHYEPANATFWNITIRSKVLSDAPTPSPISDAPSISTAPTVTPSDSEVIAIASTEWDDAADIYSPSSNEGVSWIGSDGVWLVVMAVLIPVCCCILCGCLCLEKRRIDKAMSEAAEADWRSMKNAQINMDLDATKRAQSADAQSPESRQSNGSPWPGPTFDAVAVYLDKFNIAATFGSLRGTLTLRKDPRYRPESDEYDDMYNVTGPVITNRSEGRPRFSDDMEYATNCNVHGHRPSPDGALPTKLAVPDLSPPMLTVQDTAGLPPLDLRESNSKSEGSRTPEAERSPPLPAYGPNVAVERAQHLHAQTMSPKLPPYSPQVAVQRAMSDSLRLSPEPPEHEQLTQSVSTVAVTGHHALSDHDSRTIGDYEVNVMAPILDDDEDRELSPEIIYRE